MKKVLMPLVITFALTFGTIITALATDCFSTTFSCGVTAEVCVSSGASMATVARCLLIADAVLC